MIHRKLMFVLTSTFLFNNLWHETKASSGDLNPDTVIVDLSTLTPGTDIRVDYGNHDVILKEVFPPVNNVHLTAKSFKYAPGALIQAAGTLNLKSTGTIDFSFIPNTSTSVPTTSPEE